MIFGCALCMTWRTINNNLLYSKSIVACATHLQALLLCSIYHVTLRTLHACSPMCALCFTLISPRQLCSKDDGEISTYRIGEMIPRGHCQFRITPTFGI